MRAIANISTRTITSDTQTFPVRRWAAAQFINTGTVPVTVLGVKLDEKDTLRIGGADYDVDGDLAIVFDPAVEGTKSVICLFEVVSKHSPENC